MRFISSRIFYLILLASAILFLRAFTFLNYFRALNTASSFTLPLTSDPKTYGYYQTLDFGYFRLAYFGNGSFKAGDILFVTRGKKPTVTKVGQTRFAFIMRRFSDMRNHIKDVLLTEFNSPYGELLSGMVLGVKNLPKEFEQKLITVGLIHIVVVSGFNVSLVISALFPPLLFLGRKLALIITLIGVLCFVMLVGFEPPIIRAALMGLVVCVSKFYGREYNSVLVLMGVALLMLFINPLLVSNVSFLLSFSATFGIIVLPPLFCSTEHFQPVIPARFAEATARRAKAGIHTGFFSNVSKMLRESFITTLSAQIAVWPIICYYFGRVSIVSILVNVLVVWLVPFITISGFLYLAVILVSGFLPLANFLKIMAFVVYVPLVYMEKVVDVFSSLSIASIDFKLNLPSVILYYVALLGILLVSRKKVEKL